MVGNGFVIGIAGGADLLIASAFQDPAQIGQVHGQAGQALQIFPDLFGHRGGQDSGVRPGIGRQFLFIQLLGGLQSLVGTDLEEAGTVILQLGQVVKQGRPPGLLLMGNGFHHRDPLLRRALPQIRDQGFGVLLPEETAVLVKTGRIKINTPFHGFPFRLEAFRFPGSLRRRLSVHGTEGADDPVEGGLDEVADLPLPPDHHAQDTGHDPAHGDHAAVLSQEIPDAVPVFEGQGPGKVDTHQVVLLGPQIGGGAQVVIFGFGLCLPDAAQDLLPGLGIDPDPFLVPAGDPGLLGDQAVDIFPFPSGVGTDINGLHLRIGQDLFDDRELLFDAVDDLVLILVRDKGNGRKGPPFIFLIVGVGITHGHQMPDAPGHDGIRSLHIAVPGPELNSQGVGELPGDAGLFCNKNTFGHVHSIPVIRAPGCPRENGGGQVRTAGRTCRR